MDAIEADDRRPTAGGSGILDAGLHTALEAVTDSGTFSCWRVGDPRFENDRSAATLGAAREAASQPSTAKVIGL